MVPHEIETQLLLVKTHVYGLYTPFFDFSTLSPYFLGLPYKLLHMILVSVSAFGGTQTQIIPQLVIRG